MKTILLSCLCFFTFLTNPAFSADYERNKAVPVEKVLFGKVQSVRNITEQEIIEDKRRGWKVFGGALVGGAIGSQFGSGSGRNVATILGALLGGSLSNNNNPQYHIKTIRLVELMIKTDEGKEFMVIQDLDSRMVFQRSDAIRLIYLANGSVRIDKQI
jgi:outer membrane lipoprotein SlyB